MYHQQSQFELRSKFLPSLLRYRSDLQRHQLRLPGPYSRRSARRFSCPEGYPAPTDPQILEDRPTGWNMHGPLSKDSIIDCMHHPCAALAAGATDAIHKALGSAHTGEAVVSKIGGK